MQSEAVDTSVKLLQDHGSLGVRRDCLSGRRVDASSFRAVPARRRIALRIVERLTPPRQVSGGAVPVHRAGSADTPRVPTARSTSAAGAGRVLGRDRRL